jgi:hypothetical protein
LEFKLLSGQQTRKHLPLEATLSRGFRGAKGPHGSSTELHNPRYLALIFQVYIGHIHKTENTANRWTKFKEWDSIASWEKWGHARGRRAFAWSLRNYAKLPLPHVNKLVSLDGLGTFKFNYKCDFTLPFTQFHGPMSNFLYNIKS